MNEDRATGGHFLVENQECGAGNLRACSGLRDSPLN